MANDKKICVVTACGNKKHDVSMRGGSRTDHRESRQYTTEGQEGHVHSECRARLLFSEKVVGPYRVMAKSRAEEPVPHPVPAVAKYDTVIYFKAGARDAYKQSLEEACKKAGKKMVSFRYGFMGDIGSLQDIICKESE